MTRTQLLFWALLVQACTELNPSLISGVEGLSIQGGMGGGPNQEVVPPIKGCPLPAPC